MSRARDVLAKGPPAGTAREDGEAPVPTATAATEADRALAEVQGLVGGTTPQMTRAMLEDSFACSASQGTDPEGRAEGLLARLGEMQSGDGPEMLLRVQMLGTHSHVVDQLRRATQGSLASAASVHLGLAAKLQRLFLAQIEALQRLQGRASQQKVTVEHVHVNQGGQAVIGPVATRHPTGCADRRPAHGTDATGTVRGGADRE